jgi:pimeloyl-ACP methyl ester carboxylesterase
MDKWYLLPGMGADSSMYDLLRKEVPFEINYIDWPRYRGEKTFAEVAKRIVGEKDIKDGDIVGGSSLGGMIGIEIARLKSVRAVVLLGSAVSSAELQGSLSFFSPLIKIVPISLIQAFAGKSENVVAKMFAKADAEFIRAMSLYMPGWHGLKDLQVPLFRIHGEKDRVIRCSKTGSNIVKNAGHFLAMTNSKECGAFLNKIKVFSFGE